MTKFRGDIDLKTYLETRLDLLTADVDSKLGAIKDELVAIVAANDVRYQQRFDAQSKALDFAAAAAKEAVTAALAGADKAAIKTEQTSDKRFADLGDLIREQFKGLSNALEGAVKRLDTIEGRLNVSGGETAGTRRAKDDMRALWMLLIATAGVVIGWLMSLLKG